MIKMLPLYSRSKHLQRSRLFPTIGAMILAEVLAMPIQADAAPDPKTVNYVDGEEFDGRPVIRVSGRRFSSRESASPILYDFVDRAIQNGASSDFPGAAFAYGRSVPGTHATSGGDPNAVWHQSRNVTYVAGRVGGVPSESARYRVGHAGFLGKPTAYEEAVDADNKRLYVSWYVKFKNDPRYHWSVYVDDAVKRTLLERTSAAEAAIGTHTGTFLGLSNGGWAHFEIPHAKSPDLKGQPIYVEGVGGLGIFPETYSRTGWEGREGYLGPGSNKYLRVWETGPRDKGLHLSWTNYNIVGGRRPETIYAPFSPGEWHFVEVAVDTSPPTMSVQIFLNGRFFTEYLLDPSAGESDIPGKHSPTVAALGFQGGNQPLQVAELDNIYVDSQLSRIIVANAPNLSAASKWDLQIPISWSDNEIRFARVAEKIRVNERAWLFIFDQDGHSNREGFPICPGCTEDISLLTVE